MAYHSVIVAIDISDDANKVLSKALELLRDKNSQLHLIHVIAPLPATDSYDLTPTLPLEFENILMQRAEDFISQLAKEHRNANISTHVKLGSLKAEIFSLAEQISADLIVLGTHGQHGIALLLGSSATSVLHGTPCDVLAVRVGDKA